MEIAYLEVGIIIPRVFEILLLSDLFQILTIV